MALSWHHLPDKARYWSKIVILTYPLAFDAPVRGVSVGILPSRLVWENENGGATRWWTTLRTCNRLDALPACDRRTNGRTDGQTSCHGIVRAMHTRRAEKPVQDRDIDLQCRTNRKSYNIMIYRGVPFSITLNDPYPGFKVTPFFNAEYFRNGTRYIVSMKY